MSQHINIATTLIVSRSE